MTPEQKTLYWEKEARHAKSEDLKHRKELCDILLKHTNEPVAPASWPYIMKLIKRHIAYWRTI
jgi:hypothetical protein